MGAITSSRVAPASGTYCAFDPPFSSVTLTSSQTRSSDRLRKCRGTRTPLVRSSRDDLETSRRRTSSSAARVVGRMTTDVVGALADPTH